MTVRSTNYSSLDEVWGETVSTSQKPKKEKRKKIVDPICDLYQMGNNGGFNDNDIVNYANTYFEKYDKTPYQRSMNNDVVGHESDVMPQQYMRERPVREVVISSDKQMYDVTDDDDVSVIEQPPQVVKPQVQKSLPKEKFQSMRYFNDDEDEPEQTTNNFAFIDLLLYVISGIILIFVMEQFVKIGLLLQ
jgi:hypothetical protein